MTRQPHIALLNPNTNAGTTRLMTDIVRKALPDTIKVSGHTMSRGPLVIANEKALTASAEQVVETGVALANSGIDGLLISGFGDPGLNTLRTCVDIPVTGIAEAGMAAAAVGGRRFSIITTTIDLEHTILRMVRDYGWEDCFASLRVTPGDIADNMFDLGRMQESLIRIAWQCEEEDDAEALLIGGGPLASAARAVADNSGLPIIEPVLAGALMAWKREITKS